MLVAKNFVPWESLEEGWLVVDLRLEEDGSQVGGFVRVGAALLVEE